MSYYIDVGEQDKALAQQIAHDQETLAEIHQTVADTRDRDERAAPGDGRPEARRSTRAWPTSRPPRPRSRRSRRRPADALAKQKAAVRAGRQEQGRGRARPWPRPAAAQKRAPEQDRQPPAPEPLRAASRRVYNGTLRWPMGGTVTQNFGCTGLRLGAAARDAAPTSTAASTSSRRTAPRSAPRAPGPSSTSAGTTPTATTRPGSWSSPTAQSLQTWYAHMSPTHPGGIHAGSHVRAGQVIGYEGNTGHSTGAHLHWAVDVQRQLRQPAAVPVAPSAGDRRPSGNARVDVPRQRCPC